MPVKKASKTQQQSLAAAFKSTPSRITKPSSTPAGVKNAKSVTPRSEAPSTKSINLKLEEKSKDSEFESQESAQKKKVGQDEERQLEASAVREEEEGKEKDEEDEEDETREDEEVEPAVTKIQRELVLPEEVPEDVAKKVSEVTARQVKEYADMIKRERKTPAVHQEDLTQGEKVLRHFDLSSQYGPCVGITRFKRWIRANKLKQNPPIEVMAVLMDANAVSASSDGDGLTSMAHVHELLASKLQEN